MGKKKKKKKKAKLVQPLLVASAVTPSRASFKVGIAKKRVATRKEHRGGVTSQRAARRITSKFHLLTSEKLRLEAEASKIQCGQLAADGEGRGGSRVEPEEGADGVVGTSGGAAMASLRRRIREVDEAIADLGGRARYQAGPHIPLLEALVSLL